MNRAKVVGLVCALTALVALVAFAGGYSAGRESAAANGPSSTTAVATTASPPTTYAPMSTSSVITALKTPTGFTKWDDWIAWKWTPRDEARCDYGTCWGVTVYAYAGCPNGVFVEVGILGDGGTLIGKGNAIGPAMSMLQKANISVHGDGDYPSGTQARITQMNCMGNY